MRLINVNTPKMRFLKTFLYLAMFFTKRSDLNTQKWIFFFAYFSYQKDQCERAKADVFPSVFVQKRSSVNK